MLDVIIAGAGPAGSIAALALARAGTRVLIVDRDSFPRDKLCGDTLNPGAVALLASLGLSGGPLVGALRLDGMLVTGPGASVRGRYRDGGTARAVTRADLDHWLLSRAIAEGARFEPGIAVRGPLVEAGVVRGLVVSSARGGPEIRIPAGITIAADGGHSTLARALGLARPPKRPRRWAFGAYATGVTGLLDAGEMHVRVGRYVGVAPLADGRANVCVVTGRPRGGVAAAVITRAIALDPALAARFANAEWVGSPRTLGPLAMTARAAGVPGLLLAGDAAGFVDPMTGDGLHLAMRGGLLAAEAALFALENGDPASAVRLLTARRRRLLGRKQRFNRALRFVVGSATGVRLAGAGAWLLPRAVERLVNYAGDVE